MRAKQDQEECDSVMQNDSFGVDIDSFLDLVGFGKENENNTATTLNLSGRTDVFGSRHNASAIASIIGGRKIPKIVVHTTSKTRCFAENYVPALRCGCLKTILSSCMTTRQSRNC